MANGTDDLNALRSKIKRARAYAKGVLERPGDFPEVLRYEVEFPDVDTLYCYEIIRGVRFQHPDTYRLSFGNRLVWVGESGLLGAPKNIVCPVMP